MNYKFKRIFDITIVILTLPITLPLGLAMSLLILVMSNRPVLYFSNRVGKDNKIFRMVKFRSMRTDTPAIPTHLMKDPSQYLTPIGSFLRKTSFDEIPQIWNILIGDMSFVGPRPALYNQYDLIDLRSQRNICSLLPGLTGWAQINGRDDISIVKKVELDFEYFKLQSFSFDIKILVLTAIRVFKKSGISH